MKLLIASGIYPPDIGGPATYSQIIAREFVKRGINISVICYSDKKQEDKENFKIVRILRKNKLFRYLSYFWNLFKLAKSCDVIYAQGPLSAGLPAMWVSKILRKKFIIKIVGDYAWEQGVNQFGVNDSIQLFQEGKKTHLKTILKSKIITILRWPTSQFSVPFRGKPNLKIRLQIIRKIQKNVCQNADNIIVPSEFLKRIVTGWDVEESKIKVIYNAGPDIEKIKKIESNKELTLKGDIIISAGRLERWKGMDMLIEIMPDLLEKNPNFRLIIVGSGPEWENLKSQILELKLSNQVELIGKLPHDELMKYFKASSMFVLNTAYEGLPHIILEAMACGLPVITTNVCGNPEVVGSDTGLKIEMNTKVIASRDPYFRKLSETKYENGKFLKYEILKLWKDDKLKDTFIKNGYKALGKFKLETMINKTINALKI